MKKMLILLTPLSLMYLPTISLPEKPTDALDNPVLVVLMKPVADKLFGSEDPDR
jgi:hypothetical protein